MADLSGILDEACAAMLAGDIAASDRALIRFEGKLSSEPPDDADKTALVAQLERLRSLSEAADAGLSSARDWLRDLQQTLGGLDIYDRSGRQRVETGLAATSGNSKRF